jgi:hypothetical protein
LLSLWWHSPFDDSPWQRRPVHLMEAEREHSSNISFKKSVAFLSEVILNNFVK